MKKFFRLVEDIPLQNSPESVEVYFRGKGVTGLIEKQVGDDQLAVLLFISGEPGTAHLIGDDQCKSISIAEFSSIVGQGARAIILPDVAGRLTQLALESQAGRRFSSMDAETWRKQVSQWESDEWSGLVEIRSQSSHGFVFFWRGGHQQSDLIFSTPQGFINEFPNLGDTGMEVVCYSHAVSAHAYQCAVLRLGVMHWSRSILERYQQMVGQKLLQMLDRELNRQIQPWHWNITFVELDMLDRHFFPHLTDAAHAYRALFMAMGAQMDFVIGGTLTQRLLNETFEQITPEERAVLQSQRLIPAAFSE